MLHPDDDTPSAKAAESELQSGNLKGKCTYQWPMCVAVGLIRVTIMQFNFIFTFFINLHSGPFYNRDLQLCGFFRIFFTPVQV